jgi:5'-methylthioadenosine phosphorylase
MLGIIGGTGLYQIDGLAGLHEEVVDTPFGSPSAPITIGELHGQKIAFLPRHGSGHELLPSEINYRANIYALKSIGVTQVLGVSAVGSLIEELPPGALAIPSQYIDLTKGLRPSTFFGKGLVAHISSANPVCSGLSKDMVAAGEDASIEIFGGITYACVEGPRLGTRAESLMLKGLGGQLVGMTNVPEAFLAREAQICYASICVVTDYDSWLEDPVQHVTVEDILTRYAVSLVSVKRLISDFIQQDTASKDNGDSCSCRNCLQDALLTPKERLSPLHEKILAVLGS